MPNIHQGFQDYENMLLHAAKYSGNKEPGKKSFSASMLGNDPLQNFLKFKHGSKDAIQFEANTLGSIYQLGVDAAAQIHNENKNQYTSALRLEHGLPNGWTVSGEMDQVDKINRIIFDNKVTTATTLAKIKSEGRMHQYALQLGVYKWLMSKVEPEIEYATAIPLVDKGFSYFKPMKNNQLEFIEVETYGPEDIELMLIEKTNELDQFIELDQQPDQCSNLFLYGRKGQAPKKMRCLYYCDFSSHCNHFSNHNTAKNVLDSMMDL